jgi:hypothetical protein
MKCSLDLLEWKSFDRQNVLTDICSAGDTGKENTSSSEVWFFRVNGNGDYPAFPAKHVSEGNSPCCAALGRKGGGMSAHV